MRKRFVGALSIILLAVVLLAGCDIKIKLKSEKQPYVPSHPESSLSTVDAPDTLIFKSEFEYEGKRYLCLRVNFDYCTIEFKTDRLPDIDDPHIALCVEAAFTGKYLDHFEPSNIAGPYVVKGKIYEGYKCKVNTGLLYLDGCQFPRFANNLKVDEWVEKAHEDGASLFQQILLIHNGKKAYNGPMVKRGDKNYYRAACRQKGRYFCIIQSLEEVSLGDFMDALVINDINEALYLDTGLGWNYGWYKETSDSPPEELFKLRSPYQTNWLVVRQVIIHHKTSDSLD